MITGVNLMFKEALNRLREAVTNRQYGRDKGLVYIKDLNQLLNDWDRLDSLVRKQHHKNQELKNQLEELQASVFIPLKSL